MSTLKNQLMAQDAVNTQVFSGGACSRIDVTGNAVRNETRDALNVWLDAQGYLFFEPQIHESTHGRGYVYEIDGPAEQGARKAASLTLYELGDGSLAGVTCMEAVRDATLGKKVLVWLSGSKDPKGKPSFAPAGDLTTDNPVANAHLKAYIKAGTDMRKNLLDFLKGMTNVKFVNTLDEAKMAISEMLNN